MFIGNSFRLCTRCVDLLVRKATFVVALLPLSGTCSDLPNRLVTTHLRDKITDATETLIVPGATGLFVDARR